MDKMYVLIRKNLSKSQQAVQGGHAVAEYILNNPECVWSNGTLVYLAVKDEEELISWSNILKSENINYSLFREPDIGNQITAIATVYNGDLFQWEILL